MHTDEAGWNAAPWSSRALHAVLSERVGISADMALRLSALFGNAPRHWLNMQAPYDLQQTRV